jgi:hypothetical protein
MRLYLASAPHTFKRYKDGKKFSDYIFGVKDENIYSRRGFREFESSVEKDGYEGDFP